MKRYIISLLCLLVALARPALGQDNPQTKAQPPFPVLPYEVVFEEAPEGGTVELLFGSPTSFGITSGTQIRENGELTVSVTPADGYRAKLGYPKVYKTGDKATPVKLTYADPVAPDPAVPDPAVPDKYTFTMPAFPVTVEMAFEKIPTNDARLRSLSYVVGSVQKENAVPGFNNTIYNYNIVLPSGTSSTAMLTLTAVAESNSVTISPDLLQVVLEEGIGSLSVTVTAGDGTTLTYTVNFTIAPADSRIVTLGVTEGGTISASYKDAEGKTVRLKSGDAIPKGTVLTLDNTPLTGYAFKEYNVNNATQTESSVTVGDSDLSISGSFTKETTGDPAADVGTPAVPADEQATAVPKDDQPLVIIPDLSALPSGTNLLDLQLVKNEVPDGKEAGIKELIKEQSGTESIDIENMEIVEITLVQVNKTVGSDGSTSTTVTPVQPSGKVQLRIPYPGGTGRNSHDFTLVHLRSDGAVDIYSAAKGNLRLADGYMEIDVTSFSPFAISYKAKSNPPYIPPVSIYYTVTLPDIEGVSLSRKAGGYTVEEGYNFSFALTVLDGYELHSVPVVKTSRGETLEPRASDGKYVVRNVGEDITVTIEGIVRNDGGAVANAVIASGRRVWAADGTLHISLDSPARVCIVGMGGRIDHLFDAPAGETQRRLRPGLYLVRLGEKEVFKVAVR